MSSTSPPTNLPENRNLLAAVQPQSEPNFDDLTNCPMCGSCVRGRQMKKHALICKGILVTWTSNGYMCSAESPTIDHETSSFGCPRCSAVLESDEEFQVHVATEHGFFWRLDFSSEEEYRRWSLAESFDETMIAGQSKRMAESEERSFYCASNSSGRKVEMRCPCRMVVKRPSGGQVSVRYFPAHNHSERVVKKAMTKECREMVERLINQGKSNAAIVSVLQRAYPENSRNHHISKELISSIRYKQRQRESGRMGRGRPKVELVNEPAEVLRPSS